MDLRDALLKALEDTENALVEVRNQMAELMDREEALEDEQRGLTLALARHRGETDEAPPRTWSSLNRIEAVEKMLRLAGEPLSPKEITARLNSTDRTDDRYALVSAALAYMKRQEIVQQAGYGLWELTPDHRATNVLGPEDEGGDGDNE